MYPDDRRRYLSHLKECVAIARKYGYTAQEVANDVILLSRPRHIPGGVKSSPGRIFEA